MEKFFNQKDAAAILGFTNYRSLNKLIAAGELECIKRSGRNGRKIFATAHLENYIKAKTV